MASLNETFDANSLPESSGGYDPLPAGWYEANITSAELHATKTGTGQYIKVRYDITGPTHEGRVIFGNLNIRNANPKAEEIGRQELGSLMRAIGLPRVQDTDELIGGRLSIKLSIRPADGQYEASNEVKGFRAIDGATPSAPAAPAARPSAAAPAASKAPWAK